MADNAILIIDSDTETAQDTAVTLESEDFLVFMASTEEIAVALAKKVKPALILLNPAMAGANGLEICKAIHRMDELSHIPIVALASFEGEMDPRYRSEYGIVKLLRTPFTQEELISKTKDVLSVTVPDTAPGCTPEREETETPGSPQESTAQREGHGEKAGDADRIVVRLKERKEEEKAETKEIPVAEPEPSWEPPEEETSSGKEDDSFFVARRPARRPRSSGSRLSVPIIAAALIIILGAAGVIVYKMGLFGGTEVKKPPMVRPLPAVQGRAAQESAAPVQKPEQNAVQEKPLPPAAVSSPPPAQEPVEKPTGAVVYSVQIGAFKNENNAEALVKHYKEKGYDAFVQAAPRDKEILYRVLVGKFRDRKEAGKLALDIRNKENVAAIVTGE